MKKIIFLIMAFLIVLIISQDAESLTLVSDYTLNLTIYHSYDDSTGTLIQDLSENITIEHNGTKEAANTPAQDADMGVNNNATKYTGSERYDIYSNAVPDADIGDIGNNNNFTIKFHINTTGGEGASPGLWITDDTVCELRQRGGGPPRQVPFAVGLVNGNAALGRSDRTNNEIEESDTSINDGTVKCIIMAVNDDIVDFYIDGSLDVSRTFTTATGDMSTGTGDAVDFRCGARSQDGGGEDNHLVGQLDEFALWRRHFNANEAAQVCNTSNPLFFDDFLPDLTPPTNSSWNVTSSNVISGEDSTAWDFGGTVNVSSNNLSFTFIANEISNWTCSTTEGNHSQQREANINNLLATTDATEQAGTLFDNLSHGANCMYCSGIDPFGNEPTTGVSSSGCLNVFFYDFPKVTLASPLNNSNTSDNSIDFNFSATTSFTLINASFYLNTSGWARNTTITSLSNNTVANISVTLQDGVHLWNVEVCSNKSLCSFADSNFTLIIDTTGPTITHPGNVTLRKGIDALSADFDATDPSGIDTWTINWTTNFTINQSGVVSNTTNLDNVDYIIQVTINDTLGNSNFAILKVTVNELILRLDGVASTRKYELGTTVNLTTVFVNNVSTICFDILDDTGRFLNQSCGINSTFNYTIDKLVVTEFNDSTKEKNVTPTDNITYLDLDNITDLVGFTLNITGINSPKDISIDIGNDGTPDAVIPGRIIGNDYVIDSFIFNNVNYSAFNLSFDSAGRKTIFLNITSNGDRSTNGTLNFTIIGFDIDRGNEFDYDENFSSEQSGGNTTLLNVTSIDSPVIFDDMISNDTFNKYDWGTQFSGTFDDSEIGINTTVAGKLSCVTRLVETSGNQFCSIGPNDIDFREINQLSFEVLQSVQCRKPIDAPASVSANIGYFGETNEIYNIFSTTTVSCTYPDRHSVTTTKNFTIYWDDFDNKNTLIVKDQDGTTISKDIASLEGPIRLVFKNTVSMNSAQKGDSLSSTQIDNINISGIGLNRTSNAYFPLSTNWTSLTLFESPNNIERAKFISLELAQEDYSGILATDTSFAYWLSNDNGSTWEIAVNDTFHSFSSTGKSLKIRTQITSNNSLVTPIISNLNVLIVPTGGCNLNIDIGSNSTFGQGQDMKIGFALDNESTPIGYNGTDQFIRQFPCTTLTCNVPITLTTNQSCQLEISKMNYTKNPNPLNFTNLTAVEFSNPVDILFNLINGIIEVKNLALEYFGSKNITVVAFQESEGRINVSQIVQVRYSQYNKSFPSGQPFWVIQPSARVQSNIQPFGQNSSTGIWTLDSTAYDDPFGLFVRYNETINSCVENNTFSGMNLTSNVTNHMTLNVTNLTASYQQVIYGMNDTIDHADIFTFTDINCGGNNDSLFIPFFCFKARCQDCVVDTIGWDTSCEDFE